MSGNILFLRKPYFTFERFRGLALCGKQVNIPYGSILLLSPSDFAAEKVLTYNGDAITLPFSENGVTHFCRHDDGHGPERGRIIAASRAALPTLTEKAKRRSSQNVAELLFPYNDILLFDNPFYDADIDDLREFVKAIGIRVNEN